MAKASNPTVSDSGNSSKKNMKIDEPSYTCGGSVSYYQHIASGDDRGQEPNSICHSRVRPKDEESCYFNFAPASTSRPSNYSNFYEAKPACFSEEQLNPVEIIDFDEEPLHSSRKDMIYHSHKEDGESRNQTSFSTGGTKHQVTVSDKSLAWARSLFSETGISEKPENEKNIDIDFLNLYCSSATQQKSSLNTILKSSGQAYFQSAANGRHITASSESITTAKHLLADITEFDPSMDEKPISPNFFDSSEGDVSIQKTSYRFSNGENNLPPRFKRTSSEVSKYLTGHFKKKHFKLGTSTLANSNSDGTARTNGTWQRSSSSVPEITSNADAVALSMLRDRRDDKFPNKKRRNTAPAILHQFAESKTLHEPARIVQSSSSVIHGKSTSWASSGARKEFKAPRLSSDSISTSPLRFQQVSNPSPKDLNASLMNLCPLTLECRCVQNNVDPIMKRLLVFDWGTRQAHDPLWVIKSPLHAGIRYQYMDKDQMKPLETITNAQEDLKRSKGLIYDDFRMKIMYTLITYFELRRFLRSLHNHYSLNLPWENISFPSYSRTLCKMKQQLERKELSVLQRIEEGITSPEIPMQLLVLSLVEVLPVSEFHQLISSNLQGERLRSANHAQFAEKKLENIKRCNQIQFVAVTDGFLISLVGVAHNLSDEIDRVKSGWLMRTINLMKIKQDFHTFDKSLLPSDGDQNLESSLSHWKAYPYFLIGTSSSVAFKPCPVVAPRLMLGQIHQIPIRRFSDIWSRSLTCTVPFVQGIVVRKFPLCVRYFFLGGHFKFSELHSPQFLISYEDAQELEEHDSSYHQWLKAKGLTKQEGNQHTLTLLTKSETAFLLVDAVYLKNTIELLENPRPVIDMKTIVQEMLHNCVVVVVRNVHLDQFDSIQIGTPIILSNVDPPKRIINIKREIVQNNRADELNEKIPTLLRGTQTSQLFIGTSKGELSTLLDRLESFISRADIQEQRYTEHLRFHLLPIIPSAFALDSPYLNFLFTEQNQQSPTSVTERDRKDQSYHHGRLGLYRLWPYDLTGIVLYSSLITHVRGTDFRQITIFMMCLSGIAQIIISFPDEIHTKYAQAYKKKLDHYRSLEAKLQLKHVRYIQFIDLSNYLSSNNKQKNLPPSGIWIFKGTYPKVVLNFGPAERCRHPSECRCLDSFCVYQSRNLNDWREWVRQLVEGQIPSIREEPL